MLAISTLETFSQTGFQTALIQKKENVESYLDTAWTVSAIRGALLFLILFLSAPVVAKFFNSPQAMPVIKVIAVSTLLSGFRNIGIIFFQKELEFNKQFFYELSATLVDLTIAITLAFMLRNVWALVWGGLAANFVRLFMSYVLHPYRPHVRFDKGKFKELFGFGRWVLGSSILIFLVTQGDDIFVGKMLGVTALGFYQMAYLISNLPATEITHVISQVTFPAYSKLQNDVKRLREAYLDALQLTAFVSIPMAGGIFVLAPEFTQIFLGEKWMPMVPAIQVLVLAGLARSIAATTGPIFHGIGRPRIDTIWQVIRLVVLIALIYPFTMRWGILGASISVLFSILVSTIGFSFMVIKITRCELKNFGKMIVLPMLYSMIMIVVVIILKDSMQLIGVLEFFLLVVVGVISYFFLAFLFDSLLNYRIKKLIREKLDFL
jgi:O-antigen/teichoic acid export membrane protein